MIPHLDWYLDHLLDVQLNSQSRRQDGISYGWLSPCQLRFKGSFPPFRLFKALMKSLFFGELWACRMSWSTASLCIQLLTTDPSWSWVNCGIELSSTLLWSASTRKILRLTEQIVAVLLSLFPDELLNVRIYRGIYPALLITNETSSNSAWVRR